MSDYMDHFVREPQVIIELYDNGTLLEKKFIIKCDGIANTISLAKELMDEWTESYCDYDGKLYDFKKEA